MRMKLLFILLCFVSQVFAQEGKLIFAVDLIRHGDRTPLQIIPKASYAWTEGLGQLTATGMQQEYQLGMSLRKKYIQENPLLPSHYAPETLYVRSTDVDRTLMSAQSALLGLYPLGTGPVLPNKQPALPSNFQPIPIHTIPKAQDEALITDQDSKKAAQLLTKYVFPRNDWKEKNAELQPEFARWSELTGIKINNLFDVVELGDTVYVYQQHQIPLPPGMTQKDAEKIIAAWQWGFATAFKPLEVGVATGSQLLSNITDSLIAATTPKSKLKFMLISAHDVSILSLMSVMQAPLDEAPPYAAELNFALYEVGPGSYQVKITYNGQAVTIPNCGGTTCTLEQFKTLSKQTPEVTHVFA